MTTLLYNGSFEGFLTAVFDAYADKHTDVQIRKAAQGAQSLFGHAVTIHTDEQKAARVWNGLCKRTTAEAAKRLYCAYLSELENEEDSMLSYLQYIFASDTDVSEDYSHPAVMRMAKVMKMTGREKHRMEAFVRFELGADGIYHASIEPDFNVLPLIVKHFTARYGDQKWIIFDRKRRYGMFYNGTDVQMVHADTTQLSSGKRLAPGSVEAAFQQLWKVYFKSTNIRERRNMKLHLQHIPLRYWKYLSEKQPILSLGN